MGVHRILATTRSSLPYQPVANPNIGCCPDRLSAQSFYHGDCQRLYHFLTFPKLRNDVPIIKHNPCKMVDGMMCKICLQRLHYRQFICRRLGTQHFYFVAIFVFLRDVWIRTQKAAVASRRANNLATHLAKLATHLPDLATASLT